ncbi:hypothetical protein [Limisalsivibrio acetivorans]|uniref:hypothetical protein n=1 Tax=Limisalsivibrio acetivorans TaxID=1304888 RepID=UPI0003B6472E|nr:hypothetical protein [Limisalsivibrio acetivorans]
MKRGLLVLIVLISVTAVAGVRNYVRRDTVMYVAGNEVAFIRFGAVYENGAVKSWVKKGEPTLYASPSEEIVNGRIMDYSSFSPTGEVRNGFIRVAVYGTIKKADLSSTFQDATMQYEDLYYEKCGSCHRAVSLGRYSKRQWYGILTSMQSHAGLSPHEIDSLYRYIILNKE